MQLPTSLVVGGVTLRGRALKHKTVWLIEQRDGEAKAYETPSTGRAPFAPSL
jgi:hypothetical protein